MTHLAFVLSAVEEVTRYTEIEQLAIVIHQELSNGRLWLGSSGLAT